jgi:hypothetical protein
VILIGPSQFRPAQLYVLGVCVLGGAVYGLGLLFEPVAMRRPLAPSVQAPLTGPVDDAGRVDAGGGLSDTGPFSKVDPDQWRPTRRPSAPDGLAPTRIRFELTPELARRRLPNLPNAVVVVQGAVVNVDTATPVETLAALTTWMRKAGVVQLPNLVTQRLPDPRLRPVG